MIPKPALWSRHLAKPDFSRAGLVPGRSLPFAAHAPERCQVGHRSGHTVTEDR
jgi:hypothetical protein